ncbi:MAG: monofunctional biosynthetic peptidoglycan transglycosylase [Acidobacteria bacterium]|nr:monofunctional biosynthetic peptidoglycan transglycosylase [Acidobacteriota bacterium]
MWRRVAPAVIKTVLWFYAFWIGTLILFRWVTPPTTGVQMQRRVESWFRKGPYEKRYTPVPMARISPHLRHALVAGEDTRFYDHWGLDVVAMADAAQEAAGKRRRLRGASTLTQQLIKNLYFTTHANPVRKVVEWTLAPVADFVLGKERVLELYLNVIEWGPGVYGAEAASRYHFRAPAASLSREQAARLAACVPAPRRRRPAAMSQYGAVIENRMRQLGY